VRVVNRALTSALGVPADRLLGATRAEVAERLTDVIQDAEVLAQLRDMPAEPVTARTEVVVGADRERSFRWRTKPVPLPGGTGQLDLWTDMTAEAALFRAALTDGLTTLANRSGAERAIRRELARSDRDRRPLSFLLLDIDNFKRVNDGYGHNAGDGVIRGVAKVLPEVLRASDIAARWGGEEFLVVLPDTDLAHAARVGERIRAAVERGSFGIPARVTVSVGAAQRGPDEAAEATIGRADTWLYEAKETGRNRVVARPWPA
jgi:diguanylate cyclase (GGDEF)-like protein